MLRWDLSGYTESLTATSVKARDLDSNTALRIVRGGPVHHAARLPRQLHA
ncbi:hypothetical protein Arub01_30510 [Actinomadura rubrobrunea]|uniref:Uncharacterized protein n=1 Tax=Actinomadura rubrobrunea TaxID=115335 RepID=A0A9W6PW81_9ACTN|nr:hypothetical protein Arub01_30510 [Actinomadura rubrobrunea]